MQFNSLPKGFTTARPLKRIAKNKVDNTYAIFADNKNSWIYILVDNRRTVRIYDGESLENISRGFQFLGTKLRPPKNTLIVAKTDGQHIECYDILFYKGKDYSLLKVPFGQRFDMLLRCLPKKSKFICRAVNLGVYFTHRELFGSSPQASRYMIWPFVGTTRLDFNNSPDNTTCFYVGKNEPTTKESKVQQSLLSRGISAGPGT